MSSRLSRSKPRRTRLPQNTTPAALEAGPMCFRVKLLLLWQSSTRSICLDYQSSKYIGSPVRILCRHASDSFLVTRPCMKEHDFAKAVQLIFSRLLVSVFSSSPTILPIMQAIPQMSHVCQFCADQDHVPRPDVVTPSAFLPGDQECVHIECFRWMQCLHNTIYLFDTMMHRRDETTVTCLELAAWCLQPAAPNQNAL